jgi:hypothetical protein
MKSIFANSKGYGVYSEEYKNDVMASDRILSQEFKRLVALGYNPAEICHDLISSLHVNFCTHSIYQGIEDRKEEKKLKKNY